MEIEDIKVGEYVRTNSGRIYKLSYYNEEEKRWIVITDEDWFPVYTSEIVKHSTEVIDLVEKGDYVNGHLVDRIDNDAIVVLDFGNYRRGIANEDVKTIITKEKIKEIEYKVGEQNE